MGHCLFLFHDISFEMMEELGAWRALYKYLRCHFPALICTTLTDLGAFLAVLRLVFTTFCPACFTKVRTNATLLFRFVATEAHELC
jgi:hypothetical protein